jgi:hypothetical protein
MAIRISQGGMQGEIGHKKGEAAILRRRSAQGYRLTSKWRDHRWET